jgi:hypothetical protein
MRLIAILTALILTGCATAEKVDNPTNPMDARAAQALALSKIGESATDGETKRLALVMVALLGNTQQTPQAPAMPRTIGEAALTFLDRSVERLFAVAPAWFAYKGQVRSSQTTETVAAINRDVSVNQSNNFLALGQAGIAGTAFVGVSAVNGLQAVASRPQVPTTAVTGNSGPVQIGSGSLVSGSQNPVNPTPVVCVPTATGTACSR